MSSEVFSISADANLEEAAFQLNTELIGGAPVSDRDGTLIGIVSKTDIVDVERDHKTMSITKVRDVMHHDVWSVTPETPVQEAAALMAEKGMHRLLVVDASGKPVGMLSAMDLVRAIADRRSFD